MYVGFDWHSLPRNSVIIDVGGGAGHTSMVLAKAFSSSLGLRFIIQDRPGVIDMGEKVIICSPPLALKYDAYI